MLSGLAVPCLTRSDAAPVTDAEIDARLAEAMDTDTLRDAVDAVTAATGAARKRVYRRALACKAGSE